MITSFFKKVTEAPAGDLPSETKGAVKRGEESEMVQHPQESTGPFNGAD